MYDYGQRKACSYAGYDKMKDKACLRVITAKAADI